MWHFAGRTEYLLFAMTYQDTLLAHLDNGYLTYLAQGADVELCHLAVGEGFSFEFVGKDDVGVVKEFIEEITVVLYDIVARHVDTYLHA